MNRTVPTASVNPSMPLPSSAPRYQSPRVHSLGTLAQVEAYFWGRFYDGPCTWFLTDCFC
jgi:hypothetical protein